MSLVPQIVVYNNSPVQALVQFGSWDPPVLVPAGSVLAAPYNNPAGTIWVSAFFNGLGKTPTVVAEIYPQVNMWQTTPAYDQLYHAHVANVISLLHPNTFTFSLQPLVI
jgi:hypothetical protein